MFDIEYKGANAVTISTKNSSIVVDPKLSLVGLKDLSVKGAIELATESRFKLEGGERIAFEYPGDYEAGDFSIKGIAARRHIDDATQGMNATIYRIEVNDVRIALLGNIDPKLSDDQLEEIGVIDILILPIGGNGYTLDATSAAEIVRQNDPKVIIPVHYSDNTIKYEVPQDDFEVFAKELGMTVEEVTGKYKVKSSAAIPETPVVLRLTRTS